MQRLCFFALAFAFVLTGKAEAHYYRLAGPPVFETSFYGTPAFRAGETRSDDEDGGRSYTLVARTFTSAEFIEAATRWGTHHMQWAWVAPPDVLIPGHTFITHVHWNITQRWNRFGPTGMGLTSHLDGSPNAVVSLGYGYGGTESPAAGDSVTTWTVINDKMQRRLIFYEQAGCGKAMVQVTWTYNQVEGNAPANAASNNPTPTNTATSSTTANAGPATATATVSSWHVPNGNDGTGPLPATRDPVIFENGAGGGVTPGATRPTTFTLSRRTLVTLFWTYHYQARKHPGTLALRRSDGTTYGPWPAAGAGSPAVPNAYWWVQPNVLLSPGTYTVIDSDPKSWSTEYSTNGAGDVKIWGQPQ